MSRQVGELRQVKGGLDNAVKQADARRLSSLFVVDADCHIAEPYALMAKYAPEPLREVLQRRDEEIDPFFSRQDAGEHKLHEFRSSVRHGKKRLRSEVSYPKPQGPEELIDLYTRRMHDLGIKRSVVFPTPMLHVAMDPRPEFEVGVANAYIDFMLEHLVGKYKEVVTSVYAPTNSPERAAELIDRVGSEKGIIGVMVPSMTQTLGGSDKWAPIYEAAQSKGLPILMHAATYAGGFFGGFDKFIGIHTLSRPVTLAIQITSIIYSGIPERYPKLKFVFIEGGVTWIPWLMQRMDSEYVMRRDEAPLLTKLPSKYIKDFYYTSQPLEYSDPKNLKYAFDMFDAENHLMYASDYPHWDFDIPTAIYDLPFLSRRAKEKIMGENAAKLFRLK
jgi:predicted TIM-barrel fold metal-dependent hydrolase